MPGYHEVQITGIILQGTTSDQGTDYKSQNRDLYIIQILLITEDKINQY